MRLLTIPLFYLALCVSLPASAKPELVFATLLDLGHYEKVKELTVYGDIEKDIILLAENNIADSEADVFIIDNISENIDKSMVMVSLSLYIDHNGGLVKR